MDTEDEETKRKAARAAENEGVSPSVQRMNRPLGEPDPDHIDIRQRRDDNDQMRRDNEKQLAQHVRELEDERRRQSGEEAAKLALENATVLAGQAALLEDIKSRSDALGQEVQKKYDGFEKDGGTFAHEKGRYKLALGNDDGDPYDGMRRAAGTEYALFREEQERYDEKIENEVDLSKRRQLTMQKDIRAAEHLAFTSERIADQAEVIHESRNNDVTERFEARANEQKELAQEMRADYNQRFVHRDPKYPSKDWEKEERETYERDQASARQEAARRTQYEASASSSAFDASSAEITDSKAEKLAKLQERWDSASREVTSRETPDGPTPPMHDTGISR